jgi:hypothetical protein
MVPLCFLIPIEETPWASQIMLENASLLLLPLQTHFYLIAMMYLFLTLTIVVSPDSE